MNIANIKCNGEFYHNIGLTYKYGDGIEQDYSKAKEMFEMAIEKDNNIESIIEMGKIYLKGYGVEIDLDLAEYYFRLAGDNNEALYQIGYIYYIKEEYNEAIKYFKKALLKDNLNAINTLGYMYLQGYGVEQNFILANLFFQKAIKLNDCFPDPYVNLIQLYSYDGFINKDINKAKEYLRILEELIDISQIPELEELKKEIIP